MVSDSDRHADPCLGKLGVEIELLAPAGKSREDLAVALAGLLGGKVRRFFHPQGEPSKVPNTPVFENLTLGFVVEDQKGRTLAKCVDDLTLQKDLHAGAPPRAGWYRVVSDDARFLRLVMRHANPCAPLNELLIPLAKLFGTEPEHGDAGMVRVTDETGAPIAIGARLPGERERPCEIVSRPISENHSEEIELLLKTARDLEFTIPQEAALHLHFDATPICNASTFANLVRFLGIHSDALKDHFKTNPECRRLGRWPIELFDVVAAPDFASLTWTEARERLLTVELSKYCDFNFFNVVHELKEKHTFEVRILPVSLETEAILDAARVFTRIIAWAGQQQGKVLPIPPELAPFLSAS